MEALVYARFARYTRDGAVVVGTGDATPFRLPRVSIDRDWAALEKDERTALRQQERAGIALACHLAKASANYQTRLRHEFNRRWKLGAGQKALDAARLPDEQVKALQTFYQHCGFLGVTDIHYRVNEEEDYNGRVITDEQLMRESGINPFEPKTNEGVGAALEFAEAVCSMMLLARGGKAERVTSNLQATLPKLPEHVLLRAVYEHMIAAIKRGYSVELCWDKKRQFGCRALFFQTDKRQRHCPAWPDEQDSACGKKFYMRRFRRQWLCAACNKRSSQEQWWAAGLKCPVQIRDQGVVRQCGNKTVQIDGHVMMVNWLDQP